VWVGYPSRLESLRMLHSRHLCSKHFSHTNFRTAETSVFSTSPWENYYSWSYTY